MMMMMSEKLLVNQKFKFAFGTNVMVHLAF